MTLWIIDNVKWITWRSESSSLCDWTNKLLFCILGAVKFLLLHRRVKWITLVWWQCRDLTVWNHPVGDYFKKIASDPIFHFRTLICHVIRNSKQFALTIRWGGNVIYDHRLLKQQFNFRWTMKCGMSYYNFNKFVLKNEN